MNNIVQSLEIMEQTKQCNDEMIAEASVKQAFSKAINDAIAALKKQVPEEPFHIKNNFDVKVGNITFKKGTTTHKCFSCGGFIRYKSRFCHECGQAMKW